ncbi:MAG: amidase [Gammaproteobacteria bacterium]
MKRRNFLAHSLTFGAALSTPYSLSGAAFAASMPGEIVELDALSLSRAIQDKQVSCLEVMDAYLAHIARHNPVYNAIVSMPDPELLRLRALAADEALASGDNKGWMHGMPFAVKDLQAVAGLPFTSGSPMFAERIAQQDSNLASKLRAAGVVFIGKTNTPEFGLGSQSYNPVFGATGSACNPDLTAGGSSGGAASGLGTHMLPVADGSDMMGSLRNPGAFNNVIGFRPSVHMMSGVDSEPRALSTSGPMGRNTRDTIALLNTISASRLGGQIDPLDLNGVKLAWLGDFGGYLAMEPGITELCESSLLSVTEAGAQVESTLPLFTMSDLWECWTTLRHSGRASMRRYYDNPETRDMLKPELAWEIQQSMNLTDGDRVAAGHIREAWYRELDRLFQQYDFLVLPTAQVFPYDKNLNWPKQINGRAMDTYHRWMEVVIPGSLGGIPVINVPVGFDVQGRPMGMQVMGKFGEDRKVLQFALAYEQITDFLQQRPQLQSV